MNMHKSWAVTLVSLVLTCAATPVFARDAQATLQAQLQARLDVAYGLWGSGDAARFIKEFMTEDVVITASDSPKVWMGTAEGVDCVRELMKSITAIRATGVYTRALGPNAAMQFVTFQLTARDPKEQKSLSVAKSLYVWVKTAQGWRVVADHYSFAGMDMPH
jgi:ketosteroid isomerase-like protein